MDRYSVSRSCLKSRTWTDGGDGAGLVHRTKNKGYPIEDEQEVALTKRRRAMAKPYQQGVVQASPDELFWVGLATHLEGVADLIRRRFAA